MKISHTELEECRKNPRVWYTKKFYSSGFLRPGYDALLRLAIYKFHKTGDKEAARKHLESLFSKQKERLKNIGRIKDCVSRLNDYIRWYNRSGTISVEQKVRVNLYPGGILELVGELHRVDINEYTYRAIFLGDFDANWKDELRFPLIQRAVAIHYGLPEDEIEVGVQSLDGSGIRVVRFDSNTIKNCIEEFISLGSRIKLLE